MNELDRLIRQRGYRIAVAALLFAAVVGFFAGTRNDEHSPTGYGAHEPADAQRAARSYAELREQPNHANQELYTASLAVLQRALPQLTDPVSRPPGSREDALATRASLRAYDGAPPLIPHVIDQRAQPNCLACHEQGARIGDKLAPAMSHGTLANCVQCHAPSLPPRAPISLPERRFAPKRTLQGSESAFRGEIGTRLLADRCSMSLICRSNQADCCSSGPHASTLSEVGNAFEPSQPGEPGARAWLGAPPVMPHSTWMRERCSSCHGVTGKPGIRTTHPERQNCQQCHASQAIVDQRSPYTLANQENP